VLAQGGEVGGPQGSAPEKGGVEPAARRWEQAVEVARENAVRNRVAERLRLAVGSVEKIRQSEKVSHAPIVFANILAPILVRLLQDEGLADLVSPGGHLILSGILETQADQVLGAAERAGLTLANRLQISDWVTLTVTK
jgi:ribosomal protein L11 methyltransferase